MSKRRGRKRRPASRRARPPGTARAGAERRTVTEGGVTREVEYRPDALARLYARGLLDLQQHEAGVRLRRLMETARVFPLRARPPDRVYLDPDVMRAGAADIAPRTGEALRALTQLQRRMGAPDWPIVAAIVWHDARFAELPRLFPRLLARYSERTIGPRVAEAFDRLAKWV